MQTVGSLALLWDNTLKNFVSNVCKEAGIQGHKTNHSLQATAATRLYASGVDEQLVMERIGHRNIEGIRSYKRTSTDRTYLKFSATRKGHAVINRPLPLSVNSQHTSYHHLPTAYAYQTFQIHLAANIQETFI